ncbi:MAG: lamin tail domain-containing protein [Planctomycetota bacterium]|jgi:hypothetical protein
MWDYHWVVGSGAYPTYLNREASHKAGQGRFYAEAASRGYGRTFEGMVQVMKDYIDERAGHMDGRAADSAIPNRPVIASLAPEGYPANALTFTASPFRDPQGAHTFAAMKWRLAEVEPYAVVTLPRAEGTILIPEEGRWKYFKGTREPSTPPADWRRPGFNDSQWLSGVTPIGYGESFIETNLADMRGSYSTFYVRKEFDVADPEAIGTLRIEAMFDDGINGWINGALVASNNVSSGDLPHTAVTNNRSENHSFTSVAVVSAGDHLVAGTNVVAAQLVNQSLGNSSDCFFDIRLTAENDDPASDEPSEAPGNYVRRPGKYEIDAVWETDELTEFYESIAVPASLVRPGRTYRVRCRMKDTTGRWSHWSVPIQFVAGEPIAAGLLADLRITELMYNPADALAGDNDDYESIELKNIGDETLDLRTVSLAGGVVFDFASGDVATLGPGQFVLIVRNRMAFLSRYGADLAGLIAGEYEGRLANGGENIELVDFWNGTVAEFEYSDGRGWPLSADGAGHSLVPLDSALLSQPAGSLNYGGNWRASTYINGSPGADDPAPLESLVINEFMAGGGSSDWIELYNPTDTAIDLADVYLSDEIADLKKWAVAAPAIGPRAFLSFDASGDDLGFGLSRSGEELYLSYLSGTALDRIIDCIAFEAQEEDISLGRYPDGGAWWFRMVPSPGVTNEIPLSDVVIDEVMYHPADVDEEYIELFNPTDVAIGLGTWRLSGGVECAFAADQSLVPQGRLVVVGFDPVTDVTRYGAFLTTYVGDVLMPGVDIVGPWQGNLANAGERVALEKPQVSDDTNDPVAWIVTDEVIYSDVSPWPARADGQGDALQRISSEPTHSGNDPANWRSSLPTPGNAPQD